jgi:cubilin
VEDIDCGGLLTDYAGDLISPGNDILASNSSSAVSNNTLIECSWKINPVSPSTSSTPSDDSNNLLPVFFQSQQRQQKTLGLYFDIFEVPFPSETTFGFGCMFGILTVGEERVSRWSSSSSASYGSCGNKTNSNFFLTFPFNGEPYSISLLMNRTEGWRGIKGRYSVQDCGGEFNVHTDVNITSPNYPYGYPPNTLCSWIFKASEGNVVLEFTDFEMEGTENDCQKDYVRLEAGAYSGAPVIGTLCGSYTGKIFKSRSIVVVTMKTDSNGSKKGFALKASLDEKGCGGHFKYPMMDIKSPNYPNDYPNNVECIWNIEEDPGYKLQFTFKDRFDIEKDRDCNKDYVKIQEYFNNDWVTRSNLCGYEKPNNTIQSRSSLARIVFRSNHNVTGTGFRLHYQILCGGTLQSPEGVITSPNYPNVHPAGSFCEWTIDRPNDYIVFNFDDFVLEGAPFPGTQSSTLNVGCAYDSVVIFGSNNTATSIPKYGPFCGQMSDSMKQDFISKDYMKIKMTTDDSLNYRGFKGRYKVFSCGGAINDSSFGIISSPDLPPSYQSGINCTWVITVKENKALQVKFSQSTLRPCFQCSMCDHLEIRDGNNSSSPLIDKICEKLDSSNPMILKSSSNSLFIRFVQNQVYSVYSTQSPKIGTSRTGFELVYRTTVGEKQGCGGVYRHGSQTNNINPDLNKKIIASPDSDKDGKYDSDLDCNWILMATEGTYFTLNFEFFDLEKPDNMTKKCSYDYLEIRDGGDSLSPVIDRICGKTFDPVVVSSSQKLFIHFHSDSGVESRGFKINFSVQNVSCGGKINVTNMTQVMTSPNFPSSYPPLLRCRWHFVIDNRWMNKVSLNFTVHEIDCDNKDKIEFAFALGDYNPFRMCGRIIPPRLIGPNDLWMTFNTGDKRVDHSFRGFRLEYKTASCNETYRTNNGIIASPNFPLKRSLEKYCLIKIEVEKNRMISLYFNEFDVSSSVSRRGQSDPCSEAGMQVHEGSFLTSPLLASFCGSVPPNPVFSTSNQVLIYVKAPRTHYYSILYTSSLTAGCGGNITAFNASFTSPWFPNKYNSETPCLWSLQSQGHHSMTLSFSHFDLTPTEGCSSNYLEIYEGLQEDVSKRFARYCGQVSILCVT